MAVTARCGQFEDIYKYFLGIGRKQKAKSKKQKAKSKKQKAKSKKQKAKSKKQKAKSKSKSKNKNGEEFVYG